MIHGNYYEDRLGSDITGKMANWIKTYDSDAKLFLNDYDILTARMARQYVQQIQELLAFSYFVCLILHAFYSNYFHEQW